MLPGPRIPAVATNSVSYTDGALTPAGLTPAGLPGQAHPVLTA